ncbi:hypothetical protein ALC57_13026 [Trachymyrmex cornetzi]|uniref:Uncharacterized protein n=1 Tax=Trachymyrmex cornetzi TaxID=471704 RepID=A0A151J0F7_9HYME|nr:hypothetical protein ALC57_13026 [Trachymyrmex cornetzi]
MSNVHSRSSIRDCTYIYVLTKIYKTREQPTRRAKQRNHIDPEPYTRHGRRVRINKDFPSRASRHSYTRFRSVDSSFRTIDPHYTPAAGRGASLYSAIRPFAENMHASYLDPTATNSHEIWVDLC